ncbi:uncharacterized protein LOC129239412 isoform X1 [Anastrepha obliqua]|uniref:uncharacterized protein LOC129239412 isoform X1 n=1 Tax=Anastrepha obliqua TaxID=95512 RepID=UPI00240986BB|nr:uncharacterized protein LOC129239412 isoform X1 [Anastrepha obliqua]
MNFSQKLIVQLIECLKNEPALWQIKNENYKNKIEKTLAWDRILETYRKSDPHATIDELKKKIASLRASHRRELQKIRKTKRSRAGADAIYVPSLWYFEHLDFLRHQKNRIEGAATSDKSSIMKSPTRPRKRKADEFSERAVRHLEKSDDQSMRDEAVIFADGWAVQYRKLDEDQKLFAKRIIDDALLKGQLGLLTYNSLVKIEQNHLTEDPRPFYSSSSYSSQNSL